MLLATVLALMSAVLHAGWNLVAKRSVDPFLALWGQFLIAGALSAVVLAIGGGIPRAAVPWAILTAAIHIPYVLALGWAYHHGDFSLAYPVARGGGALLAAIGGVTLLGDDLQTLSFVAIGIIVVGMWMLAYGADRGHVAAASIVALAIGAYTVGDSRAVRAYDPELYIFAVMAGIGVTASCSGLALGRGRALLAMPRAAWMRAAAGAVMTIAAYGLVLAAVRHAPVGYVAALRESSVLIAVFVGWRMLDEERGRIRTIAALLIVVGLALLVIAR